MPVKVRKTEDMILMPFAPQLMEWEITMEAWKYNSRLDLDCRDLGDVLKWGDRKGHLFIFGHGTGAAESQKKHLLSGNAEGHGAIRVDELAEIIRDMGFPKGADNQIYVWSCGSGVVGGFAQLLALHLIKRGYTGKKIWGCEKATGVLMDDCNLRVCVAESLRDAELSDMRYWTGV